MTELPGHPGAAWAAAMAGAGQSQTHVARALGVSRKHLNLVLHGHALPSVALTVRFAQHVGVDPGPLWHRQADYVLAQARLRVGDT